MTEHHDEARPESLCREFDASDQRRRDDVAGDTYHEEIARSLVEHELDRHARVGTAEHDRERLLRGGQLCTARGGQQRACAARVRGKAGIAFAQLLQRSRRTQAVHGASSDSSCAMKARRNAVRRSASRRPAGVCIVSASFNSLA
jgi:hypothetical protein